MALSELLVRQTPSVPDPGSIPLPEVMEADELQQELANEAKEVLGYNALREELDRRVNEAYYKRRFALQERSRLETKQKVFAFLESIDRKPFTLESVEEYKQATQDKVNGVQFKPTTKRIPWSDTWSNWFDNSLSLTVGVGVVGLGIGLCTQYTWWKHICLISTTIFALLILVGIVYEFYRKPRREAFLVRIVGSGQYSWFKIPLKECRELIPDFCIDTAIQIKKNFPEAEFYVDLLAQRRDNVKDPFLILQIVGQQYYIEVWDEKDFETKFRR